MANFVLDEKLTLDDPVNDYLDFPLKDNITFTFTELSNHTSGLPRLPSNLLLSEVDLNNPYKDYGNEELVNISPGLQYQLGPHTDLNISYQYTDSNGSRINNIFAPGRGGGFIENALTANVIVHQ